MDDQLELALLGSPEVHLAGAPVTRFRSAKSQALLYYLAMAARPQSRLTLAGFFWGGVDDHYARRNLNRTLSDLTKLVGDHLTISRQTLSFDRSRPYWLDVEAFDTAATVGPASDRVNALTKAVELYRDDFLAGFYIQDAPEFEHWVLAERTRLRASVIQLLHELADHYAKQGDPVQAIDSVRRVLQMEPWREEAHRQLIFLLAQNGQRSAALAQYEICRQALREELNVEPDAATVELLKRIRAGEFTPASDHPPAREQEEKAKAPIEQPVILSSPPPPPADLPPPHNISLQATPFVGRENEVAEVARLLLAEPDCRLLTLVGPGGMGKTRLALKVSSQLVESHAQHSQFRDGLFFVPLEAVTDANGVVSAIISAIAEESGFPLHAAAPLQEQLLDFLHDKTMLLLLDNFEHLLKHAALLSTILRTAPGVKLLVTSREALGLQEAWFYPLVGLSVPQENETQRPKVEHDAIHFFIQCARRTQPSFAHEAERAAIVRICQMVEGLPLAIELAAAWLKVLTCAQIVHELEHGMDILTARFHNIPTRHSSIRAVMEQSWRMLTEDERGVAARLSIFRDGFAQEAACDVAGASLPTLASLVEKALLRVRPDRRYQMHELTRQYAAEQVTQLSELRDAHGRYYAKFCQRLNAHLYDAQSKAMLDDFALAADNILAAWRWLIQTVAAGAGHALATNWLAQMIPPMAEWYYAKAFFQAGQQTFAEAAATLTGAGWSTALPANAQPTPEQTLLAQLQLRIGMFTYELGHYDQLIDQIQRVLPLLYAWDNAEELALALALLGKGNSRRGRRSEARTQLEASLRYARTADNLLSCAMALNNLSHIAQAEGDHAESERLLRECLAIYQRMDLASGVASTLGNLGYSFALQGDHEKALAYYHQALSVAKAQDDPMTVMVNIGNIAASHQALGQPETAIKEHQQSLQMAREQSNLRWVASNLNALGHTYFELHDYASATRYLSEGLAIAGKIAGVTDALAAVTLMAQVWMQQGNIVAALRALFFVTQQPAAAAWTKQEVQALLDELAAELPPAAVTEAQRWASAQTVGEMIAWIETMETKPRL